MRQRVYFFDLSGNELKNHFANGRIPNGRSSTIKIDNNHIPGFHSWIETIDYGDIYCTKGDKRITALDFGNVPVKVREWFPGEIQTYYLIPDGYDITKLDKSWIKY